MKKRLFTLFAVAGLALLTLVACSNKNIDTAKVRAALDSISADSKVQLDEALSAIEMGKFKEAYGPLRKIAFGTKLDPNQRKVLEDTIAKVQAKMAKGQ